MLPGDFDVPRKRTMCPIQKREYGDNGLVSSGGIQLGTMSQLFNCYFNNQSFLAKSLCEGHCEKEILMGLLSFAVALVVVKRLSHLSADMA